MATGNFAKRSQARAGMLPRYGHAAARHEMRRFLIRLIVLIGLITGLICLGAAAYSVFEGASYWQSLLWSLDTVATVGAIPQPDSLGGQIAKIVLITLGLGTMFYVLVTVTELFVAGDLFGLVEARRMQREISQLNDHYLICGFGRVGRQIAKDLSDAGASFVVIDDNPDVREAGEDMEVPHVEGRGSDDEVLLEAGIERAHAVIACIDSDAENIFVTLTARELRPGIHIVARAAEDSSERKLTRAGANEVVSPYKASGRTMADLALGSRAGEGMQEARDRGAAVSGGGSGSPGARPA
ncbi:MAG: NAD(P)-binding protein [Solirubrobacterales bacterium]